MLFYDRTAILMVAMQCMLCATISMVAMQCLFCAFWQHSDINGIDAVRVLCILAGHRYQLQRCNASFLWQDSDINGSDAVCVFGRTAISFVATQCVFFTA